MEVVNYTHNSLACSWRWTHSFKGCLFLLKVLVLIIRLSCGFGHSWALLRPAIQHVVQAARGVACGGNEINLHEYTKVSACSEIAKLMYNEEMTQTYPLCILDLVAKRESMQLAVTFCHRN
jgi:hypothetical protein